MNDKARKVLDEITGAFYGLFLLFGVQPHEKIAHDVNKLLDELEELLECQKN